MDSTFNSNGSNNNMIIAVALYFVSIILLVIASVFGLLEFTIPNEIIESVDYIFGYIRYADSLIPVNTLLQALGAYIAFLASWYTIKLTLWLFSHIPFVKISKDIPSGRNPKGSITTDVNDKNWQP